MSLVNGLTTAEVAARLGKTVRHIQWLITEGKLPAQRVGRDYFIREEDLELVASLKRGRPRTPKSTDGAAKQGGKAAKKGGKK